MSASVMMILVALFTWIYQRHRQPRVRLWMIGWSAVCVHFCASLLASFGLIPGALADWLACATLVAAGAIFLLSVCSIGKSSWRKIVFTGGLVLPAIGYVTLLTANYQHAWPYCVTLGTMWLISLLLAHDELGADKRSITPVASALVLAGVLWCSGQSADHPEYGFDLILFSVFAITSYLFYKVRRRLTPGTVLTSGAFLLWALVFPLGSLELAFHIGIPEDHVVWDLPKYAVAFGMILTLFETQAELLTREASERKRAESSALHASEAKSHFLAHMSHEIRTPMSGILGLTGLMLEGQLSSEHRENLETVHSSAQSLLLVMNDILDLSKIEAGRLDFEKVDFDPRDLACDILRLMRLRAEQKGLVLRSDIGPNVPPSIIGDPSRLRQVLLNLLSNAIKFTDYGFVGLRVQLVAPIVGDQALLRFSVSDSGMGIPADKQPFIFQPFFQADESIARRFGGTGLGLTIASELVHLMGGKLRIESAEEGVGSVFSFEANFIACEPRSQDIKQLAMAVAQSGSGRSTESVSVKRRLRVLLAEDNPVNQLVATRMMEKQGFSVTVAASGGQAIAALKKEAFDLVLMDIHMPELDGLQATRLIRAGERYTGGHIPIIAVTALAMKGDAERCLEAGMDAYISKPIEAAELVGKIRQLV